MKQNHSIKLFENKKVSVQWVQNEENWFTITFKRPDLQKESYEQRFYSKEKTSGKGGQISGQILTKGQERILELIKQDPRITRDEI